MTLVIIQARMGSTRLPGKVLKPILGTPLLGRLIDRLQGVDAEQICVATTTNTEDDAIELWCEQNNVEVSRGSDWDVLNRFYTAASKYNLQDEDLIVRICADNPLHHFDVVDFCLQQTELGGFEYFSNSNHEPDIFEDGFDTEVFRFSTLKRANKEANMLSQREHVCPYMKQEDLFKCGWEKYRKDYDYKLSVDTQNDFKLVETIFSNFQDNPNFTIDDVMCFLKENPSVLDYNRGAVINSGYIKSLREDKKIKE